MTAALLAALGRPRWWALALAAFLARGGIVLLLVPLVELPSAAGLANVLGPVVVGVAFGNVPPALVVLAGGAVLAAIGWLLASTALATWLELGLAAEAVADEEFEEARLLPASSSWAAVAVRLLAHVPTAMVLAWGAVRLVEVAYAELTAPGEGTVPVALRIALRAPEAILVVVAAWLIGEAGGALAIRRVAAGAGIRTALRGGLADLVTRRSGLATLALTTVAGVIVLGAVLLAAGFAFGLVRLAVTGGAPVLASGLAIALLAVGWVAGLWSIAVAGAWRSTAWTFEAFRTRP